MKSNNISNSNFIAIILYAIFFARCALNQTVVSKPNTFKVPSAAQMKQPVNCSNIVEILDKCGANSSYSHTIETSNYPRTLTELKISCVRVNSGLNCLRRNVKCLPSLTRTAILAFIEGRRKHYRSVCNSNLQSKEAKNFVEAYNCIDKFKRKQAKDQELMTIRQMDAILSKQVTDFKERFQRSCCAIVDYRRRSINDLNPQCKNPDFKTAIEDMIESVVGKAVEFACPDEKSGVCNAFKPLKLSNAPIEKSLTRAGTDLMIALTAEEKNKF